ncbi:MAG: branched-chain amino acid ABC transporter permease [Actinobacteria bacterium]|jgi:branched-chain amino acid transport system permease protein|nr:MAG: branched-chain amino acid ABC transporter permease [Actinomycetota bacterium]
MDGKSNPTKGGGVSPGTRLAELVKRNRAVIVFGVFILLLPLWAEHIYKGISIDILFIMRLVGVFTIAAVGLNLLMGYAGQVSLGQGAFFGIGAYTSALLTVRAGFPVWLGIALAIAISAAFGLLVAPVLRLKGHYLAMATLGLAIIVFVFLREMTWLTFGNDGVRNIPELALPFTHITGFDLPFIKEKLQRPELYFQFYFIWVVAIVVLALCANLVRSRVGRSMRALHQSEVAAEAMGVNVSAQKIKVFVLSAALGGLAGGIYANLQGYIDPNMFSITLSISILTMVVIGGMESIWGAVAGAAVITFLPKFVEAIPKWVGDAPKWLERYSNYEGIVFGLILILTMVFMPSGITRGLSDMFRYRRSPFMNPFRRKAVE